MALLDWTLVVFGAVIAFSGGWIQFHPERLYPRHSRSYWHDAGALEQIRTLGGCFLFMGCFFAVQMTTNLVRLPWWTGTISGLLGSVAAVKLAGARVREQRLRAARRVTNEGEQRDSTLLVQSATEPKQALESH
jgi:uncharacterized membrane protein HdeD (DUF308 family)